MAGGHKVIDAVVYGAVWEELAAQWGAPVSEPVRLRHTPAPRTFLHECAGCGLQFFRPAVPGDADLYREIGQSPACFAAWRWEFGRERDRLRPGSVLLDAGCGRGDSPCEPVPAAIPREELREAERAFAAFPAEGAFLGIWAGRAFTCLFFNAPVYALGERLGVPRRLGYFGRAVVAFSEVSAR